MFTIYRLQSDRREIREVQEVTRTTDRWGIEPTHGLFGSSEWWQRIRDGSLPVHHIKGKISRVYMGSMNDWPEFAMLSDTGEESEWSRYANEPEFAAFYTVGRPIEIDYVIQSTRSMPADFQKILLEIRVDDKYA
jgi:hypothetical protein